MHGRVLPGTQVWGLIQIRIPQQVRFGQTNCLIGIGAQRVVHIATGFILDLRGTSRSRRDGTSSSGIKTAPITVPQAITPVAAQATSMQMHASVPATAPRMNTSLETIGQTVTMTGATTGNLSHACHHGCPVCRTCSCFGWSWGCLGLHGTGIVDTGDWW
jgi:hypothetical protein